MFREMLPGPVRSRLSRAKKLIKQWMGADTFTIISHPRSGSNFLRDILNQHPQVLEVGEFLHQNSVVSLEALEQIVLDTQQGELSQQDSNASTYLPKFSENNRTNFDDVAQCLKRLAKHKKAKTVGFTLFPYEFCHLLNNQEACQLAMKNNMKIVFLIRRNLLQSFISVKRAVLFGAWHVDDAGKLIHHPHTVTPSDALERPIGPLDIDEAKNWISISQTFLSSVKQSLEDSGKKYCTVFYEDLCLGNPTQTLNEVNRVLRFLHRRELGHFTPHFSRTASSKFYESIPNRKELAAATGYDLD